MSNWRKFQKLNVSKKLSCRVSFTCRAAFHLSEGLGVGDAFRSGVADGDGFGVGLGVGGGVGVGVARPVLMLTRTICPVFTNVPELGDWSLTRFASNLVLNARPVIFILKPASSSASVASDSDMPVTSGT